MHIATERINSRPIECVCKDTCN
uniref:Uncharacterized protein n=1 Tax=Anguilla anguilla TaxID=7936 RepID=A0A0E9TW73_ANGAN